MVDLRGRDFLTLLDYSTEEIVHLINVSLTLKDMKKNGVPHRFLEGKNIAMIFEKDSTRTRCAFELGAYELGMNATYLGPTGSQLGHKETIEDTARVLDKMFDGIEYRGFGQRRVNELARYSKVPVWNGLTDSFHPTQMIADVMTMYEEFGRVDNLKVVFFGNGDNNVTNSLMVICSKLGMHFWLASPKEQLPDASLIKVCQNICKKTGGSITFEEDPKKAAVDADVLYTDVWVSMGEAEELWAERIKTMLPYQINSEILSLANPNAIFLHCLPSFHNADTTTGKEVYEKFGIDAMEVTDEVFESKHSRVFEEAENRLHTIKAIMLETLR